MLSTVADVIKWLLLFLGVVTLLLVAVICILVSMRRDHPLKRVLSMLAWRLGATALAGVAAVPIEPIVGLDVIYDIGVPLLLLWYWGSFFRGVPQLLAATRPRPRSDADRALDQYPETFR